MRIWILGWLAKESVIEPSSLPCFAELRIEAQKIPVIQLENANSIIGLETDIKRLSESLCLSRQFIAELEVEKLVSMSVRHAVLEEVNERNTALNVSIQSIKDELQEANQALESMRSKTEDLRFTFCSGNLGTLYA